MESMIPRLFIILGPWCYESIIFFLLLIQLFFYVAIILKSNHSKSWFLCKWEKKIVDPLEGFVSHALNLLGFGAGQLWYQVMIL